MHPPDICCCWLQAKGKLMPTTWATTISLISLYCHQIVTAWIDYAIFVRRFEEGSHQLLVHIVTRWQCQRRCVSCWSQRARGESIVDWAASHRSAAFQWNVQSRVRDGAETRHQFIGTKVHVRSYHNRLLVRSVHGDSGLFAIVFVVFGGQQIRSEWAEARAQTERIHSQQLRSHRWQRNSKVFAFGEANPVGETRQRWIDVSERFTEHRIGVADQTMFWFARKFFVGTERCVGRDTCAGGRNRWHFVGYRHHHRRIQWTRKFWSWGDMSTWFWYFSFLFSTSR